MKAADYFIALTALLFLLAGCDMTSPEHYLQEAERLSAQGKYRESIRLLDKAIEKDDQYIAAYINRGADKSALEDYRGAIADFRKALAFDTSNMLALYYSGNSYKQMGDYKTAVKYYNWALGDYSEETGKTTYIQLKMVGEFDIESGAVYFDRGDAYYKLDSLRRAYNDISRALENNYRVADCYLYIGYIYLSTGQAPSACEYFQKSRHFGGEYAAEAIGKYCR